MTPKDAIKVLNMVEAHGSLTIEAKETAIKALQLMDKFLELPMGLPKTGHWYIDERPESDREVICSNCEKPVFKYHKLDFDYRPKYCPNCGAKMKDGD